MVIMHLLSTARATLYQCQQNPEFTVPAALRQSQKHMKPFTAEPKLYHLKKYLGPPCASTARDALAMVGREAAVHIMFVLMTSRGVVAAAAKAPAQAPIAKSSCNKSRKITNYAKLLYRACYSPSEQTIACQLSTAIEPIDNPKHSFSTAQRSMTHQCRKLHVLQH